MYNACMKRLNYYVTDEQYRQLQTLKEFTGLSAAEHVRRALDQYIKELNMFSSPSQVIEKVTELFKKGDKKNAVTVIGYYYPSRTTSEEAEAFYKHAGIDVTKIIDDLALSMRVAHCIFELETDKSVSILKELEKAADFDQIVWSVPA